MSHTLWIKSYYPLDYIRWCPMAFRLMPLFKKQLLMSDVGFTDPKLKVPYYTPY